MVAMAIWPIISYKHLLITKHLNNLIELSDLSHRGEFYHREVLSSLEQAFLQAATKGDAEIMARINDEVCVREGVDPFSIQNQKEEDAESLSEGEKYYPPLPAKFESVNY